MNLAVLYSGGKDSNYALYRAKKYHNISCLITMISENDNSYMFQSDAIDFTNYQANCLQIPHIKFHTKGQKEKELNELKKAIKKAIDDFNIKGIVTGAINSVYQASRIQKICDELNIYCFNPIWQIDQIEFLRKLIKENFKIVIVKVASYPLDESFLGKILDNKLIDELIEMNKKYKLNPAGEGGEFETFVLDAPTFKKKIEIKEKGTKWDNYCGNLFIKDLEVIDK